MQRRPERLSAKRALSMLSDGFPRIDSAGSEDETPRPPTDKEIIERVSARKQRRMIKSGLNASGLAMFVAAAVVSSDDRIIGATTTSLIVGFLAFKHIVWDGFARDRADLQPIEEEAVTVREATGKGLGLFAVTDIPEGQFLMRYEGQRINDLEFERRYAADPFSDEASYVMRITEDEFIDASRPESGLARYMNHASPSKANVIKFIAQRPGGTCCFFAKRSISAGEELCYDYSDEFWQAKGITPVDA